MKLFVLILLFHYSATLKSRDMFNVNVKMKSIEYSTSKIGGAIIDWGLTIPNGTEGTLCSEGDICMDYGIAKVVIAYDGECMQVSWTATSLNEFKDCINLLSHHWYGGGQQITQPWPIEKTPRIEAPFVTADMLQNGSYYGGVSERYWISSIGSSVVVSNDVPLFVSLPDNDGDGIADQLCLSSRFEYPFTDHLGATLDLSYHMCAAEDIRKVHEVTFPKFFEYPTGIPDERMFTHPVWSTWAEYHTMINQERVLQLAQNVLVYGFNNSQIEIDDNWETCYGDALFNSARFPDPKGMVDTLHDLGFRVTLWIHPFINKECSPTFAQADAAGYFIKNSCGETQLTSWWQGREAGIIDFTNPAASHWWTQRLCDLQEATGMDSFKFDAGETSWLPKEYTLNLTKKNWPNGYTTSYVNEMTNFGGQIEVRVGYQTQTDPVFVRMLDKDSNWSYDNGLATVIPTLLHFQILGYPFCLPDMVGGNAYSGKPNSELFLRWAQLNALMPSFQFSILPWNYGEEVTSLTKEATSLHSAFAPLIIELATNSTQRVAPIVRPTWWLCPQDEDCLLANQQFLLGDDMLVTPVVTEGATTLDVVFPPGSWKRADTSDEFTGPSKATLSGISLDSIIYFTRIT